MSDTSLLEPTKVPAELFKEVLQTEIARIKSLPPDHPFVKANPDILDVGNGPVWAGAGTLELAGIAWFAAHCVLALTDVSTGVKAVVFSATGFDWAVGAFHAWVAGAFVVDPQTIAGKCGYTIAALAGVEGGVSLVLYGPDGRLYGVFPGYIEAGIVAAGVHGEGELLST